MYRFGLRVRKGNSFAKGVYKVVLFLSIIISCLTVSWGSPVFADGVNKKLKPVSIQLRWNHQFQFAGYYAAKWLGYYENEGLDVDIRTGVLGNKVLSSTDEVGKGNADFGIGSSDILLAESENPNYIIVASIFQRSPVEYVFLENRKIKNIYELSKLNIARRAGDLLDIELQAMLRNEGIDPAAKIYVNINRDFNVDDLLSKRYDVVPAYLGKLQYGAKKLGIKTKSIKGTDYGIDFYGDSLFTTKKYAKDNPETVESFRKASIKGWEYALEHPMEIAEMMAENFIPNAFPADKEEYIKYNLHQSDVIKKATHYPIVSIGNVNGNRWQEMADTLKSLKIISSDIKVDKMMFNYEQIKYDKLNFMFKIVDVLLIIGMVIGIIAFLVHLRSKNTVLFLSNSRYETIFNSSVIGITISDNDGYIIHNNAGWLAMTGLKNEKESIGKNIREFICKESLGSDDKLMEKLLKGEVKSYVIEKRYKKKPEHPGDNDFFYGKLFMTRIYDMNLKKYVSMAMTVDITGEVLERIENAKKEAIIIYQSRMAAMGEMIGNIAHQWRQPLNALGLIIANSRDSIMSNEQDRDYLINAYAKADLLIQKMSMTIDDFRNFSNPQSKPKLFDAGACITKTLELFEEQLHGENIETVLENHTERKIFGHENQFSQAIFNIISNSIDALKNNGNNRKIYISVENISRGDGGLPPEGEADGSAIKVTLKDNGEGIDPAIRPNIFNMYYTTKDKVGGTGLGLYMTKTIIENNFNGRVEIEDDHLWTGTSFVIVVPGGRK